jgi:hypothetical protein
MASDRCGGGGRSSGERLSMRFRQRPQPVRHLWGAAHGRQERRSVRGRRGRQACGGYAGGPGIPMLRDPSVGGASGKALRAPPAGGLLENASRGAIGLRRNGNNSNTPDDVRRSATLSISSAVIRVRMRDRARERPPQSLRDSSPKGGASNADRSSPSGGGGPKGRRGAAAPTHFTPAPDPSYLEAHDRHRRP